MDKEKLELEARLIALEYLTAILLNRFRAMTPLTDDLLDGLEAEAVQRMGLQAIGIADPAMSDHIAGELQDALRRLLHSAKEMRASEGT